MYESITVLFLNTTFSPELCKIFTEETLVKILSSIVAVFVTSTLKIELIEVMLFIIVFFVTTASVTLTATALSQLPE